MKQTMIDTGLIMGLSVCKTLSNESTIGLSIASGLVMGLKYNGSVKRGVKAGFAVLGTMVVIDCTMNIARNRHLIGKGVKLGN